MKCEFESRQGHKTRFWKFACVQILKNKIGNKVNLLCEVCQEDEISEDGMCIRCLRFAPGNDKIWGRGNWIACGYCPRDSMDRKVYHHINNHG